MSLYDSLSTLSTPPPYQDISEHSFKPTVTMSETSELLEMTTAPPTERQDHRGTTIVLSMTILHAALSGSIFILVAVSPDGPPYWSPWLILSSTIVSIVTKRIGSYFPHTRWAPLFEASHDCLLFTHGVTGICLFTTPISSRLETHPTQTDSLPKATLHRDQHAKAAKVRQGGHKGQVPLLRIIVSSCFDTTRHHHPSS
ncbi:hypothetical protein JOL62DRAFT_201577 [Phyllosticta paracitricarpa]|uniref:Uncharacterized protein n=1 Tax=Phyllosticta paracitricarpa TaxID=2016321 RepID=A0ABR1N0C8_9PEZI